jgi:hypothetical protein
MGLSEVEAAKAKYDAAVEKARAELEDELKKAKEKVAEIEKQYKALYGTKGRRGRKPKALTEVKTSTKRSTSKKKTAKKVTAAKPRKAKASGPRTKKTQINQKPTAPEEA